MGFERRPLEDVVEDILDRRGVTPTKLGGEFVSSGHRVISAKLIKGGRIVLDADEPRFVNSEMYARWMKTPLKCGDVIMTSEAPLGELAYLDESVDWVLGQRLFAIRPRKDVIGGRFLYYALASSGVRDAIFSRASGSTVQGIRQAELRKIEVPVPPMSVQLEVESLLGALDERIDSLRKSSSVCEAIAKTLFKSWFVDFDPVRAKAEGREPEGMDAATAALFPDTFETSERGSTPEGWEVSGLGDQLDILSGGTPKTRVPEYWDGDIPWFSVVDAPREGQVFVFDTERKITRLGLENSPARLLPVNTTIISARGTVGKLAVTGQPMAMNQSCYGLRPADGVGEFFTYFSVQRFVSHLQRIAHGAVFDTITRSSFSQAQAVKAPKEIVSAFEAVVAPLMEAVRTNGRQANVLAQIRDTLLPRLISGKLRLPDAERDIEAATA